jgi:hypothetical protein
MLGEFFCPAIANEFLGELGVLGGESHSCQQQVTRPNPLKARNNFLHTPEAEQPITPSSV